MPDVERVFYKSGAFAHTTGIALSTPNIMGSNMNDTDKTMEQLVAELEKARRRIAELEALLESQRLTEYGLRQNEKRYRVLAEDIADAIWILGTGSPNQIFYISPALEQFLGYSVNELMAMEIDKVLTPESHELVSKTLAEELAAESSWRPGFTRSPKLALEIIHRSGAVIPIEVVYCFLPGSENHPAEILAAVRDVRLRRSKEAKTDGQLDDGAKSGKTS